MIHRLRVTFCPHLSTARFSTLPKRPSNSYIHYVSDNFKQAKSEHPPNVPGKDVMKSLGKTWRDLSAGQKASYVRKAETEAQTYEKFFKTASLNLLFEVDGKKEKKFLMKKFEALGRLPKKPPHSGYVLFISRQKGLPDKSAADNMKLFAETYQKLSEYEKTKLSQEVGIMKEDYEKRMQKILNN